VKRDAHDEQRKPGHEEGEERRARERKCAVAALGGDDARLDPPAL